MAMGVFRYIVQGGQVESRIGEYCEYIMYIRSRHTCISRSKIWNCSNSAICMGRGG